jgi:16S rRNA (cytosine1402-N4)-methyltransferase
MNFKDSISKNTHIPGHIPILCDALEHIIHTLALSGKTIVDCTFGAGGHTQVFLRHDCKIIAFDYDANVQKYLSAPIFAKAIENNQLTFIHDNFANIAEHVSMADFVFADIGLSSMQLDAQDGFAFSKDTPLQMTANTSLDPLYASINKLNYTQIYEIIHEYTDLNPGQIATRLNNYLAIHTVNTTHDLLKAIGMPINRHTRSKIAQVFQAFRMYHNDEINNLKKLLAFVRNKRIAFGIICFNSVEARVVKQIQRLYIHHGIYKPDDAELQSNTRSACAILRYAYNVYDNT